MKPPDDDAKRSLAVALKYAGGDSAPTVVARVDIDQFIPPQLYVAVAELLAWLYRVERGEPPVFSGVVEENNPR